MGFAGCSAEIDRYINPFQFIPHYTTPLHDAAKAGDVPTATELLSKNPRSVNHRDRFGGTALHVAVAYRQKGVVELLLAKGADVNAGVNSYGDEGGVTSLHLAAGNGYKDIAELLLANGANVDARNKFGQTPLVVADCKDQTDVAALLRVHSSKTENRAYLGLAVAPAPSPC